MQKLKIEHQAGSGLINELARQLYRSPNESFREVISNSLDEGSKKIHIRLSAKQITFEDFGNGIQDINKFAIYGQSVKLDREGEIIGEKGLGKLSLLMLNEEKVQFLTNNGKIGMNIIMNEKEFDVELDKSNKFLSHQGTRVVVNNPTFVPTQEELVKYVSKTFGLWIKKGIEIAINDEKVTPFKHIDVEEQKILRGVTGNIKEDAKGTGTLDLYTKHVYVTSVLIDPNYLFSGWVNSNNVTPTTARDDIVKDDKYRKLIANLKEYVKKFPEKEPKDFTNEEKMLVTEINKMAETFMEVNQVKVIGKGGRKTKDIEEMIEVSVGDSKMLVKKQTSSDDDDDENETGGGRDDEDLSEPEKTQKLNDKPIRHLNKNKYGVLIVNMQEGEETPPIYFYPPNVIVLNTTNNLYRYAMKTNSSLGPKYQRILPWFARALVDLVGSMKDEFKGLNPEEATKKRDKDIDKAIGYFLELKGVLKAPKEAKEQHFDRLDENEDKNDATKKLKELEEQKSKALKSIQSLHKTTSELVHKNGGKTLKKKQFIKDGKLYVDGKPVGEIKPITEYNKEKPIEVKTPKKRK